MSTSARVSSKRLIRIGHFWMSETKGRNREDTNRGRCLSIALHPNERMTVNRPWTCTPTAAVSATAAISADNSNNRSEEHTSELQSLRHLVCRLLLEKKKQKNNYQLHKTT